MPVNAVVIDRPAGPIVGRTIAVVDALRDGKRHGRIGRRSGGHVVGNLDRARAAVGDDLVEPQARLRAVFVHLALEAARARRRVRLENRERGRVERDALGPVEREVGQQSLHGTGPWQVLHFRQGLVLDNRRDVVGRVVGDPHVVPPVLRLRQERRLRDGDDPWRSRDERPVLVDPQVQRVEFAAAAGNAWRQRMPARVAEPPQRHLHAARSVRVVECAVGQVDAQPETIAWHVRALRRLSTCGRVLGSHTALPEERRPLVEHAAHRRMRRFPIVVVGRRCRRFGFCQRRLPARQKRSQHQRQSRLAHQSRQSCANV